MNREKKRDACDTSSGSNKKQLDLPSRLKVIELFENGVKKIDIARKMGLHRVTVYNILKKKEFYKNATMTSAGHVKRNSRKPPKAIVMVEEELVKWIKEEVKRGVVLKKKTVIEKADQVFKTLKENDPSCDGNFRANRRWFEAFLKRSGLNYGFLTDAQASVIDPEAAERRFNSLIEMFQDYEPEQVFYFCWVPLHWKQIPGCAFICLSKASDNNHVNDKMNILMGSNAVGDFKVKPLVLCSPETSKELDDLHLDNLPVLWKVSSLSKVTRAIFKGWFLDVFKPKVEEYLEHKNVERKALMLLDKVYNFVSHSSNDFVKFIRISRNTKTNHQLVDNRVSSDFQRYYINMTLEGCFTGSPGEKVETVIDAWIGYSLKDAVINIARAWNKTRENSVGQALRHLWPDREPNLPDDSRLAIKLVNKKIVDLTKKLCHLFSVNSIESISSLCNEIPDEDSLPDHDVVVDEGPIEILQNVNSPETFSLTSSDFELMQACINTIKNITNQDRVSHRSDKCIKRIEAACLPYKTELKQIQTKELQTKSNTRSSGVTAVALTNPGPSLLGADASSPNICYLVKLSDYVKL